MERYDWPPDDDLPVSREWRIALLPTLSLAARYCCETGVELKILGQALGVC